MGRDDEEIPPNVTHVRIDISVRVIPERAFVKEAAPKKNTALESKAAAQ